MKLKERARLALQLLSGAQKHLTPDEVIGLGIDVEKVCVGGPFHGGRLKDFYRGEGDFAWRGVIEGGAIHGAIVKVDPVDVISIATSVLLECFEKAGVFEEAKPLAKPRKKR